MHKASSLRQLSRLYRFNQGSFLDTASKGFRSAGSGSPTVLSKQAGQSAFTEDVLKPAAFGVVGTASAFAAAAYLDQKTRKQQPRYGLYQAGRVYLRESDLRFLSRLPEGPIRDTAGSLIVRWRTLLPHQQTLYGITAANLSVLAAWRLTRLQGFMTQNFLHKFPPIPNRAYTLLTSTFSHKTIPHFLFNSIALISFGAEVHQHLGSSQFMAFFVGGGLASSVLSHLARAKRRPGGASLGSSGAVYAVFAMMAYLKPQAEAYFIFLPGVPITLDILFPCLVALDATGAVLKWRFFDHWGHLGGAVFGYLYARFGEKLVWSNCKRLLQYSDQDL